MKIYDSHIHIFNSKVVENVINKRGLVKRLCLETENIGNRLSATALVSEMKTANVLGSLLLPTADVNNVSKMNRDCVDMAREVPALFTAGTLHPDFTDIMAELSYLNRSGVRVIKLCSFSQRFALTDPKTLSMFELVQAFNRNTKAPFWVVLDTLSFADRYFGTDPAYTTTPGGLMELAGCFSGINFIGAHMGGLGVPFDLLIRQLKPLPNLYLDTSNAAHTLEADQFIRILHRHGSGHILFGTDWPWFHQNREIMLIDELMDMAGFTTQDKGSVFYGNLERILDIDQDD